MFCESLRAKSINAEKSPTQRFRPNHQGQQINRLRWGKNGAAIALCISAALLMGCTDNQANGAQEEASAETAAETTVADTNNAEPTESSPSFSLQTTAQMLPVTAQVVLGGETIDLEVTRSIEEQAKGLMFRERLPSDRGMLFTFSPARPVQFWMKNVVIDLDMVFVYRDKIVGISADVPPCNRTPCPTYGPGAGTTVSDVIELAGGRAAELGLKIGDVVDITTLSSETP